MLFDINIIICFLNKNEKNKVKFETHNNKEAIGSILLL